jgi:hypothetical protein
MKKIIPYIRLAFANLILIVSLAVFDFLLGKSEIFSPIYFFKLVLVAAAFNYFVARRFFKRSKNTYRLNRKVPR